MLVDGTPSAELAALLDGVRSVGVAGEPKFSPGVQQDLVRLVVGRAYAPALLQLCHLVDVAALAPRQRVELLFWGVPIARASAYAGGVAPASAPAAAGRCRSRRTAPAWRSTTRTAGSRSPTGRCRCWSRSWTCWVPALGYPAVLERVDQLLAATTRARTGEIANDLSRALYGFLAPHLPTAHEEMALRAAGRPHAAPSCRRRVHRRVRQVRFLPRRHRRRGDPRVLADLRRTRFPRLRHCAARLPAPRRGARIRRHQRRPGARECDRHRPANRRRSGTGFRGCSGRGRAGRARPNAGVAGAAGLRRQGAEPARTDRNRAGARFATSPSGSRSPCCATACSARSRRA